MPGPPLHLPQIRPDAVTQAVAQAIIDTQTQDATDAQTAVAVAVSDAVAKATAKPVQVLAPPAGRTPTYNQTSAPAAQSSLAPVILIGLGVIYYLWKKGIL